MTQKFKTLFLFTLFVFLILIILNIATEANIQASGWYSTAIIYFFSFSFFQISVLEKSLKGGLRFIQSHLFLTALKMFFSAVFIIVYGFLNNENIDTLFFIWFLVLYLLYTALLGWLFYKKQKK
tara:strand:- start:998 stop:1369 length:372 start_codon:yes stop_codon:yes gene_type:complete